MVLSTVGTLFPGVVATAVDEPAVAELKGRPVMAKVIDHAVLRPAADAAPRRAR